MDLGMLWYKNDPKMTLEQKVSEAAAYYAMKHGRSPTECFVHPSFMGPDGAPDGYQASLLPGGY